MFKIINVYFKFASSSLTSIAILAIVVRIMETAAKCETIKSQNFLQIPNIFYATISEISPNACDRRH